MTLTASTIDELTLTITQQIQVNAPLETTFAAVLEEMGSRNEGPDGTPMPMKLEAKPGGRWYRDLGDDDGHLWGHVQAIKRPTLLEIAGPLFMSYAVVSHLQYRLTEADGGTLVTFTHSSMGLIPEDHRTGLASGWKPLLERIRKRAENAANS